MKHTIKLKDNLKIHKWSGGSTAELFIFPEKSCYQERNFEIRISSATVDNTPSIFTRLPGYQRLLMPVNAPLRLVFNKQNGEAEVILNPFEVVEFEGEWQTVSYGICTDFGIMLSPNWSGKLAAVESGVNKLIPGFTGVYALYDNTSVKADNKEYILMKHDFLILETETENEMTLNLSSKNIAILSQVFRKK